MASRSRICSGENSRAGRSLVYSWECNMERCFCQWIGTGCNITVTLEGICYRDVSACLRRRGACTARAGIGSIAEISGAYAAPGPPGAVIRQSRTTGPVAQVPPCYFLYAQKVTKKAPAPRGWTPSVLRGILGHVLQVKSCGAP